MAQMLSLRNKCINCNTLLTSKYNTKYCSNLCQKDFQYKKYISEWKNNKLSGLIGIKVYTISRHIRRYIIQKFNNKCSTCNWSQINKYSNKSVLEINHIDGDATNNIEANLQLLCPNCHSLTNNFRNLNRGKGRNYRRAK
jgi:5-methylcytosine-specific restriction endonuclease McrA